MNMLTGTRGRWVRRGSTIVIELPGKSPEAHLSFELETSQPTVRRGSSGSAVKTLQARLQTLGFDPGPIDGIFGSGTDSAVRAFQRARGLDADGIVGPQTWAALYASLHTGAGPIETTFAAAGRFLGRAHHSPHRAVLRLSEQ